MSSSFENNQQNPYSTFFKKKTAQEKAMELDKIASYIFNFDLADLLAKISVSSLLLKTDFLSDFDQHGNDYLHFDSALNFLIPYCMSHPIESGNKIVNHDELMQLIDMISSIQSERFDSGKNFDSTSFLINHLQNEVTEVLPKFRGYALFTLLPSQNELLKKKFNISSDQLISDLSSFLSKMYEPKKNDNPTFETMINSFGDYFDSSDFLYPKNLASFAIIDRMTCEVGEYESSTFSVLTPLSLIDTSRKIFLKINDNDYCFSDSLITAKFVKCLERLFQNDKIDHELWKRNAKEWNEESVKNLIVNHFEDGIYYSNNFYYEKKGKRNENDGLFFYKGLLFVIEVKGGKVNPDSVYESEEKVKDSYRRLVEQGCEQCNRLINQLESKGQIEILNEDNSIKATIKKNEVRAYLPLCICFEEIGTYLPGYDIRNDKNESIHPVTINFYDLMVVFDYLDNSLLIAKYLRERSLKVNEKRLSIDDELVYLGILTNECLNLNSVLNKPVSNSEENITNVYFDNNSFTEEIEIYYSNPESKKPQFNINNLVKIIVSSNLKEMDNDLFMLLLTILNMSRQEQDNLENKVKKGMKNDVMLPQAIRISTKTNEEYALFFYKRPVSPHDKNMVLANALSYLQLNPKLVRIYCMFIRHQEITYQTIDRDNQRFQEDIIQELASQLKFRIIHHDIQ